jgi:sodium/pantothenate symporter
MPPLRVKRISFLSTACIGLLVFAAALNPPDLLVWINLFAFGGLEASFLWPIVLGLYWKKANAAGAICSALAGLVCFFALNLLKVPLGGIHAIVPALLAGLAAFIAGSRLGRGPSAEVVRQFWEDE